MRVLEATATPITLDRDGIAAAQTPGGAGNLTLNGVGTDFASGILATPRPVAIYSGGSIAARVFTVTGTDRAGKPITDTVTGINNSTVSTNKLFKTVSSVAVDAGTGVDVEVGYTAVSYSRWVFAGSDQDHYSLMLRYFLDGTATYDVQATSMAMNRDPNYGGGDYPDDISTTQSGKTANLDDPLVVPYVAFRLKVTAQNARVRLRLYKSRTG
jgi:VCBS repeat-containing protein